MNEKLKIVKNKEKDNNTIKNNKAPEFNIDEILKKILESRK